MRWLLSISVASVLELSASAALACSPIETTPNEGPLREMSRYAGRDVHDGSPLPRNVALYSYLPQPTPPHDLEDESGTLYPLHVVREFPRDAPMLSTFLYTTEGPLPAHAKFKSPFNGGDIETSDETIETAPAQPELRSARIEESDDEGCGVDEGSSCGSMTTLRYDVPESPGVAFLGIYLGDSPEAVAKAAEPTQLVIVPLAHLEEKYRSGDRYLAVTVFDQAGHESPKSRSLRIENGSDGCNAAPRVSGMLQGYALIAVAAVAARTRRRVVAGCR